MQRNGLDSECTSPRQLRRETRLLNELQAWHVQLQLERGKAKLIDKASNEPGRRQQCKQQLRGHARLHTFINSVLLKPAKGCVVLLLGCVAVVLGCVALVLRCVRSALSELRRP